MLLVGSRSLPASIYSEILYEREKHGIKSSVQDYDYFATTAEYEKFLQDNDVIGVRDNKFGHIVFVNGKDPIEFEITEKRPSTEMIYNRYNGSAIVDWISLNLLLKMSHRYLKNSPHFLKTMIDIQVLRKHTLGLFPNKDTILKMREAETYDYPHPNLDRDKVNFFNNNQIGYNHEDYLVYDHDDIHESVKLGDRPAYMEIRIPGEDVKCSKDLFDALPYEKKLHCVYEESAVLALERHQIPNAYKPNSKLSFEIAISKVCTSITSGWFRKFAWENYFNVVDIAESKKYNYVETFMNSLRLGNVRSWEDVKNSMNRGT